MIERRAGALPRRSSMLSLTAILVALPAVAQPVSCALPVPLQERAPASVLQREAVPGAVVRVRDQAGRAVPRAQVFVDRNPYGSIRALPPAVVPPASTPTGITDDDGVLSIARERTPYAAATIIAAGFAPRMLRLWGSDSVDEPEELEAGAVVPPVIEVVLSPSARIEGRVHGAPVGAAVRALTSGEALVDLARARVDAWFPEADAAFLGTLASDGTFVLDPLPAGAAMRLDLVQGDRVLSSVPECIALTPGEVRRVEWTVGSGAALECLVHDERGVPISAARVQLIPPSHGGWAAAYDAWNGAQIRSTDMTGRVVFDDVLPGRWNVVLEPPGAIARRRGGSSWPQSEVTVDVVGSEAQTVRLVAYDPRTISGVVVDPDGKPLEGKVHLTRMTAGTPAAVTSTCKTDADGKFRSGHLAPGTYRIVARREWPMERTFAPSEAVYVEAGVDTLRLVLQRELSLDLRALDDTTRVPADAHFSIGREGEGWGPRCPFQSRATWHVAGIPPGRLVIIARTGDGRVGVARVEGPLPDVASERVRLSIDVPVRVGGMLHLRYRGSMPSVLCEVSFDGVRVDEFSLIPGGEAQLVFPPGRGTLRWRADPRAPGAGRTPREGQRELTFVVGDTTSIDLQL